MANEGYDVIQEKSEGICALRKMRKLRNTLIAVAAAILVLAVLIILAYSSGAKKAEEKYLGTIEKLQEQLDDRVATYVEATKEVDIGVINTELQQIGELATMEFLYTDANRFSDPKTLFGVNIPFTTKSCIAKWDGKIKAGVDVTKIAAEVDAETMTLTVWIPPAVILSHEIDDESFEVLDEKDGLFNRLKIEDVKTLEAVSKDEMERRAIENGLLEKAFENAQAAILKILSINPTVAEYYQVQFKKLG